jgi:hypothetical protein
MNFRFKAYLILTCFEKFAEKMINKIVVYLMSSCVNWAFFGTRGPLHTNELNTTFFFVRRAP